MNTETDNEEVIHIEEDKNGGAIVSLPDSIPSPHADKNAHDDDSDEADEAAEQAEIEANGSVDPEAEAIRAQKRLKRQKRKEYHKQVQTEKDMKLQLLQRQNQELMERLLTVERKQSGADVARLNKAIEDQNARIQFARDKIREATESGNGELLASANEMWYEARRNAEALENHKKQMTRQPQQKAVPQADPLLQRYVNNWMANNDWYDPNNGDADSKIVTTIDNALAEEGWNPKTQEYWDELDNRLQKYLPHRYTDMADAAPVAPRRPKTVVTSSGRESASSSGGRNSFTLSPDQVKAMKEAGFWDDPQKRARMIKRYAMEARSK